MYVFVVKPDRTVESRAVITGARVDQDLVIEKGLQEGETVVLEGQLRLAPGSRVQLPGEGPGGPGGPGGGSGGQRGGPGGPSGRGRGQGAGGNMP